MQHPGDRQASAARAITQQSARGARTGATRWFRQLEGFSSAEEVVLDRDGNSITVAVSSSTIGPRRDGMGAPELHAIDYEKRRPDGTRVWKRTLAMNLSGMPPPDSDVGLSPMGLAVDRDGSIVLVGHRMGSVGSARIAGVELPEGGFLARLDPEGHPEWARTLSGENLQLEDVTMDDTGHIAVTGRFFRTLDFGRGVVHADPLSGDTIFLSRFSPSGKNLWTLVFNLPGFTSGGRRITADSEAHLLLAYGENDTLVTHRVSPDGRIRWTRKVEALQQATGIAAHGNRIVVVGKVFDKEGVTFGGKPVIPNAGNSHGFVLAYTRDGEERWAQLLGVIITDVAMDEQDGVIICGAYDSHDDLGLGPAPRHPDDVSDGNLFVARYDRLEGKATWVRAFPDTERGSGLVSVDVTDEGESVALGLLLEPLDFGLGLETPDKGRTFLLRLAR
jgi:hypothetical protein